MKNNIPKQTFLLNIAGIGVRIIFQNNKLIKLDNLIIKELFRKNLVYNQNNLKTFFTIYVKEIDPIPIFYKKENKSYYLYFFQKKEENAFEISNFISLDQFNLLLRSITMKSVIYNNGFFIHSSSLSFNNHGYVFIGNSGSGKSTIIKILKNHSHISSDDTTPIRQINNIYYTFHNPFRDRFSWIKKDFCSQKIKSIFFLHKSNRCNKILIKDKNTIVQRLLKQMKIDKGNYHLSTKNVLNFVKKFDNFFDLYFEKNEKSLLNCIFN